MNFVVDFGNTRIKAAIFNGNDIEHSYIFNSIKGVIEGLKQIPDFENCIIASVTSAHQEFIKALPKGKNVIVFEANTAIPIKNLYKSAATLGSDRIAASIGAFSFYPNQNVLTIDAGTCIKYNFVNSNNEYLGGAISPGLTMRLKAMKEFTHALPLIDLDKTYTELIGTNTKDSILSGALIGASAEVDGIIEKYLLNYANLQVVLTGGDADYLGKQLKNRLFANQNLLLYGLNTILKYNLEK
ncbi:MAG: type III pantothenate kinase [Bacteroidota bacterium]|nr:type III pantothenate kinase [Bacteroidota bacterium]MDP3147476.1 type III pantothenate kinase [Bacteroidota bacterium]MDP3557968.1 type III pantothenate kinase [Bacteroidota bacterium]